MGQGCFIEDDGFPNLLANSLRDHLRRSPNYVADGAVLPGPTGKNPSMTIAAVAERIGEVMVREEG